MREIKRIDRILAEIRKIWYTFPDWRLMQTFCNVIQSHSDSFYLEDEELEKLLKKFIEEIIKTVVLSAVHFGGIEDPPEVTP